MKKLHLLYSDKNTSAGIFAKVIAEVFNLKEVSATEIIFEEVVNNTPIGLTIEEELSSGDLIKAETMTKLFENFLKTAERQDLLIKGYPRTQQQLEFLKQILKNNNTELQRVWYVRNFEENYRKISDLSESELTIIEHDSENMIDEEQAKSIIKSYTIEI